MSTGLVTFDRAGCFSSVNNVIAGHTSVNEQKHVTSVTTGICERCEIIYTHHTTDTGVLLGSIFNPESWV